MMQPDEAADRERAQDARLARAARSGDSKALSGLLSRHQPRIFRTCLRIVGDEEAAADATQDTLLRAVRAIASFDERAQFTTWITRIAINVCLTRARSEKLRRHISLDAPAGPARTGSHAAPNSPGGVTSDQIPSLAEGLGGREQTPSERVQETEEEARVLRALSSLDPEARAILLLRDGNDLEYDQIAEVLNVAVGTVKSRLFRARQALREAMENLGRS